MTTPTTLSFAGTDDELEKYLLEFAGRIRGVAGRRAPPDPGWTVSGGTFLSLNPNTVPWRIQVRRDSSGLSLTSRVRGLPWTRAKARRIGAFRQGQLSDYLTGRVRGSPPERFDTARLQNPFTPFGESIAARTGSFAWIVLTGLAALALAFVCAVLASYGPMSSSIRGLLAHSAALEKAGAIPLPSLSEAASTGALGAAVVFALPVAFLAGLVHAAALAACDLGSRAARLPQASFLLLTLLWVLAFFPYLSLASIPLAIVVPGGAQLGATLVWGLRRERLRESGPPRGVVVAMGVILAASLAGAAVPQVADWKECRMRVALFRDGWLLGHPLGRWIASTYYRYTLYAADPLKQVYSSDPAIAARQQCIALCTDPGVAARLRRLHVTATSLPAGSDLAVGPGGVPPGDTEEDLLRALDRWSGEHFRGRWLLDLCTLGWRSLYYLGPLVLLLLLMGGFAPLVSLLFRKLRPHMAVFALCACAMVTSLLLVLAGRGASPEYSAAELAEALSDPRPAIRHEAAYRAYRLERPSGLTDALLGAADDEDLRVRLWACAALGKCADPRALPKLLERLNDPESFVRYRAAEGLQSLRDPRAIGPLLRMMRERSWYEGSYALEALRAIQPESF
jgi:hypothetical protein